MGSNGTIPLICGYFFNKYVLQCYTMLSWLNLRMQNHRYWRVQYGRVGGRGVLVSSQLGDLPGAGGGARTPEGMGGTPKRSGRTLGGGVGRRSGGQTGLVPLRGGWGRGRVPTPGGAHSQREDQQVQGETLKGSEDWKGTQPVFPLPTRAYGVC